MDEGKAGYSVGAMAEAQIPIWPNDGRRSQVECIPVEKAATAILSIN